VNIHLLLPDEPEGWRKLQQEALAERDPDKLAEILKRMNELLTKHEHETKRKEEAQGLVADLKQRARGVATSSFVLLTVALALLSARAPAQALQGGQLDLAAPLAGPARTCSQSQRLFISKPFAERARIKARLLDVLRESLYDDAKGITNIARDNEIKSLASKLKNDKARYATEGRRGPE
jgi:hypothetical protein